MDISDLSDSVSALEKEEKEERKQEEEKKRADTKRAEGAKGFVVVLILFLEKQSLRSEVVALSLQEVSLGEVCPQGTGSHQI